jgi:signal transduction histidine kinase
VRGTLFRSILGVDRSKAFAWFVITVAGALLAWRAAVEGPLPPLGDIIFWAALLAAAELLPVSLGFGTEVTMAFPIHLAVAIVFRSHPGVAMAIAGAAALDIREFKREILLHRALFNRALMMLSVGAATIPLAVYPGNPLESPSGIATIFLAGLLHLTTNLGLLVLVMNAAERIGIKTAIRGLVPKPAAGFVVSYVLLAAFGVGAAFADDIGKWAVAAILIPLLFARLSILGARNGQEMAERIQEQQKALLDATEKVLKEREDERHRIAADIHDSTLQSLAAASFASGNAVELLRTGRLEDASRAISNSQAAVDDAIKDLRDSLVDLRRSTVEDGGLMVSINRFADQISTLWGAQVHIAGALQSEPPLPVAMAALQIVQEGITNSLKHSQTDRVSVTIGDEDGMVHISVEDDGAGFDPASEATVDHVGVRLMKERATKVGGRIELKSEPGLGTRVEAVLPGGVTP